MALALAMDRFLIENLYKAELELLIGKEVFYMDEKSQTKKGTFQKIDYEKSYIKLSVKQPH